MTSTTPRGGREKEREDSPLHLGRAEDAEVPEVSMVEAEDVTGVTFTPELWMQRRHWALEVLRREGVRSVLDIGCGTGSLLETLIIPPSTVHEAPIRPLPPPAGSPPSPVHQEDEEEPRELFIQRLGGLDSNPATTPAALAVITPPSASSSSTTAFPPPVPRWEPLTAELWLGNMERYNSKLEGYEAMTCLEVIEHLDPNILSRFGVVTMGTYRPRLLLVTTPNFDFNAKFPKAEEHDHSRRGFVDPTGRTERLFRHSDHKLEMTNAEFVEWAQGAAADWGYSVEISGVGISSKPSYYPTTSPDEPRRPVYATQTAIFRIGSSGPARSPRSVRTTELPFMPGSRESTHSHRIAGKFIHPATIRHPSQTNGNAKASTSGPAPAITPESPLAVRQKVKAAFEEWDTPSVTLSELWGKIEVAVVCGGSKRYLVGCLGGYGDVAPLGQSTDSLGLRVVESGGPGRLSVKWSGWKEKIQVGAQDWGKMDVDEGPGAQGQGGAEAGGW